MSLGQMALALVTVGALALAGCGAGADGEQASPTAVTASVTVTASVEATSTPTAATAATGGTAEPPTGGTGTAPAWAVYEEADEHRVRLAYPASWTRNPDYLVQFDGPDGFVQVSDLGNGGQGLDAAVEAIAHHKLMPYGSSPTLERVLVDGVESVFIRPSDDQLPANVPLDKEHVAVVIPRGEPLHIGGTDYEYLVLYMDEAHADSILASVALLPPR